MRGERQKAKVERQVAALAVMGVVAGLLVACGSASPTQAPGETPTDAPVPPGDTLTDAQGAVEVAVTPLNLGAGEDTLIFSVVMNTHSVELDMDLAALSTLITDTGLTVEPLSWETPDSGHHVTGTLTFPALVEGQLLLDGATQLTLTIREVDVPERVFVWALTP